MTVNGVGNATDCKRSDSIGGNMQMDSISRNLKNQIANAQKKLQELSSNQELSLEEKMKKRQEIQQEISSLTQQLRQHQIELRKQQQNKSSNYVDELTGAGYDDTEKNKGSKRQVGGISQGKMSAMISADSAMKQAQVQGSVATQINGKAGVLESEIAMDKGRGSSTEKKEQELADLQGKAQQAAQAQMSSLADAKESISKAGESDNETDRSADGKKTEHDSEKVKEDGTQDSSEPDSQNIYKKIDIRLEGDKFMSGINSFSDYSSKYNSNIDYSALFGTASNSSVGTANYLSDYASIRNGSYKKLMKAYYAKQDTEKLTAKQDTVQKSTLMGSSADSLKVAADKLNDSELFDKDDDTIVKAVKSFIESYNDVVSESGESNNKSVLRNAAWLTGMTGKNAKLLSKAGITIAKGNKLELDEDTLKKADKSTLKSIFNGYNSFAGNVSRKASAISNASNGAGSSYTSKGTYYSKTAASIASGKIDKEV